MSQVVSLLGRLFLILAGYIAAVLAASLTIHLLFLGSQGFSPDEAFWIVAGSLIFSIPFVALFVAYFAFVPSIVAIFVGEVVGVRNWLFYAIAGAGIGIVMVGMFSYGVGSMDAVSEALQPGPRAADADAGFPGGSAALVLIASGIVAGMVYWLVAGRLAGNWRNRLGENPISPGPSGS